MTPAERTLGTRVELYGREALPAPAEHRREQVADRLESLVAAGAVDDVAVSSWPSKVPTDGSADGETRDRYLAFARWADERGVSLAPFFQTRECYSMATGERGDWVVLPVLCLAIYEDGDLASVYPHADGDAYHSVLAGLATLDDDEQESTEPSETLAPGPAD